MRNLAHFFQRVFNGSRTCDGFLEPCKLLDRKGEAHGLLVGVLPRPLIAAAARFLLARTDAALTDKTRAAYAFGEAAQPGFQPGKLLRLLGHAVLPLHWR